MAVFYFKQKNILMAGVSTWIQKKIYVTNNKKPFDC